MGKFVISPHFRLQEWVAEEKGYFNSEGLDYEFRSNWEGDDLGKRPAEWLRLHRKQRHKGE